MDVVHNRSSLKPHNEERRRLLKLGLSWTTGMLATRLVTSCNRSGQASAVSAIPMPTRALGRTGVQVGIMGLGGQAAIDAAGKEDLAVAIVERALDLGINYIDTAPAYGPGRCSERSIGQVMKGRRSQAFLASKTHRRTRDESLRLLDESLRLLQCDHLDLWQIHDLSTMEQVDQVFARGGAIEALVQAREQKMVHFLGVTGHADPRVLTEAILRFPFDCVLMAVNAADRHQLSFIESLLPLAVQKGLGIAAMKIAGNGRLVFNWKRLARFQRPGNLTMQEAMHYVLTLPVNTAVIGCGSVAELERNVEIARSFAPLPEQEMHALETRTRTIAQQALYFRKWSDS